LIGHPSPEHQSHSSEFWQGPSTTSGLNGLASHHSNENKEPTYQQDDHDAIDRSNGSVVIRDGSEEPLPPVVSGLDTSYTANSQSSEIDPVDQMVDELLTSPDLAGLVNAQAGHTRPTASIVHGQDRNCLPGNRALPEQTASNHIAEADEVVIQKNNDFSETDQVKPRSRFPYVKAEKPDQLPERPEAVILPTEAPSTSNPTPLLEQISPSQAASFQPIPLSSLGLEDSLCKFRQDLNL
jgi:hypothetical protein